MAEHIDMTSLLRNISHYPNPNTDESDGIVLQAKKSDIINTSSPRPRIKNEQVRLDTFVNSPYKLNRNKSLFALCGFIFLKNDQCECQFCFVVIDNWNLYDDPLKEHIKHSKNCPLLTGITDNEPISIIKFNEMLERAKNVDRDVCGIHNNDIIIKSDSVPETNFANIATLNEPEHPTYRLKTARMNSYREWPQAQLTQKAADLSDAGFFYTGTGDRVICFQCGGGLKDWDRDDVPWEQHALWYDKCEYLKLRKGLDYINKIKEMHNANVAKSETTVEENTFRNKETSEKDDDEKEKELNKLCVICMDKEYNTVYIPCGHAVSCDDCASSVSTCPYCRQKYENVIRIFLR